jgi:chromosome segregation ATPase
LQGESKKLLADVKDAEARLDEVIASNGELERKVKAATLSLTDVRADLEAEQDDRSKAEKAQKVAQAAVGDLQAELKDLEAERGTLDTKLKAKTAEAQQLGAKAASDSVAKEVTVFKEEKKKAQAELDVALSKLSAAEGARARNLRKLKKLQAELADQKAANAAADKNKGPKSSVNVEEETKKIDKELKVSEAGLADDERDLKNINAELELLRGIFRTAVTTVGVETILGMDGRAAKSGGGSRSGSGAIASVDSPLGGRKAAGNTSSSRFK